MYKKGLAIIIIVLFIGASVVSGFSVNQNNSQPMSRAWLYVGGTGPGNYTTIQSAITAASAGDTIFVYSKTYYEHVNIGKSISLIGENKDSTIINGSGSSQAIEILTNVDDITIKGFTCTNANFGIYQNHYCDGLTVYDNILKNNLEDGIRIDESSGYGCDNEISGNTIMNNSGNGIYIKGSSNNIILNNAITNNGGDGIYIYFNSDYNDIYGNTFSNNSGYGIHISSIDYNNISGNTISGNSEYGIYMSYSDYNHIFGNVVSSNNGHGLYFGYSDYSNIYDNSFSNNSGYGVYFKFSLDNLISANTIKDNTMDGLYLAGNCDNNSIMGNIVKGHSGFGILIFYYSDNNQITYNTITDNGCGIQIFDHCNYNMVSTNTITDNALGLKIYESSHYNLIYDNLFNNLDNSYDGCPNNNWNISKTPGANIIGGPYLGGNSFNDYAGADNDGDGLGDTPYNIPGAGGSSDFRPLTAWDDTPPEITNIVVDPSTQNYYENVRITCDVTDEYTVAQVCLIITYPDSSNYNYSMNPGYYYEQVYSQIGSYSFFIWAVDGNNNENVSAVYTFEIVNLPPEKPAKPSGKAQGKVNVEYTYSSSTTEPDADQVYYWFDWGDGTNSDWVGPFTSGEDGSAKHTWTVKGTYQIKVKAKDSFGAESDWSDPLPIKIPRSKSLFITQPILHWLLERLPNAFVLLRHLMGY